MTDSLIEDDPGGVNGGPAGASSGNAPEYSVSEISGAVKRAIEGEFGHVRVRGEVGRVSQPRSGHVYLDLKDARSVLSAVIWKGVKTGLEVQPEEGDEVVATGRLTTFPGQSKYQLIIEALSHAGEGALLAKLERLKAALAAEGLFSEERKRAIPYLPRVIGVVTSPSGAVIRDILHRLAERCPVRVLVWPVAVQGQACAPEVAAAIRGFGALAPGGAIPRPDVLIVARGGGSVEDLWGFNEEIVVRAAAASPIPLVSAVGHETDTTLIDFAADRRAPTPTAAAEIAVPVRADLLAVIADLEARRRRALARALEMRAQRLRDLARALPRPGEITGARAQALDALAARLPEPREILTPRRERLAFAAHRLPVGLRARVQVGRIALGRTAPRLTSRILRDRIATLSDRLADRGRRLAPAEAQSRRQAGDRLAGLARLLGSLGYRETLARGFAVVRRRAGDGPALLTDAAQVSAGDVLEIEFRDGRAEVVSGGRPAAKPARKPPAPDQGSLF
ncbi:MAG: exodeoxyribonuclease VII large subunit [Paracoccaceae bacterium]